MFFYVNSTLALFGYHYENELLGAVNFLLSVPGWDELAMKCFISCIPRIIQGTPSYSDQMRKADLVAKRMYQAQFASVPHHLNI